MSSYARRLQVHLTDAPQAQARNESNQHNSIQSLYCGVCHSLLDLCVTSVSGRIPDDGRWLNERYRKPSGDDQLSSEQTAESEAVSFRLISLDGQTCRYDTVIILHFLSCVSKDESTWCNARLAKSVKETSGMHCEQRPDGARH